MSCSSHLPNVWRSPLKANPGGACVSFETQAVAQYCPSQKMPTGKMFSAGIASDFHHCGIGQRHNRLTHQQLVAAECEHARRVVCDGRVQGLE